MQRENLLNKLGLFPRVKRLTWQRAALVLFPTQRQVKLNPEADLLQNARQRDLSHRRQEVTVVFVHTGMTQNMLTQLKWKTEGNCFNPEAREGNSSAEHNPACTYGRKALNTS